MKYLFRALFYAVIFYAVFSVSCVIALRFVPVTVTPFKIARFIENLPKEKSVIRSYWTPIAGISIDMQKAVIATEDNYFLDHHGFDFEAIRQAMEEYRDGERLRGGSTISQQTTKNVFCTPSRTWFRKGVESYYTVLTELLWSKRHIMEVYLNVIEVRPNMYGAEAAARHFYDSEASRLNNYEAAMIATVLPNPERMNIANPSTYMTRRAARVRSLMASIPNPEYGRKNKKTTDKE